MLVRNLCNFQQSQFILVLNERATLHVSPGLVRHLHNELVLVHFATQQVVEDVQIHSSTQIIDVGQEAIFATFIDELLEQAGILERLVEVTVTGWIPTGN